MLEDFLNLEKKVNILADYCKNLKEENTRLKEMLSKNESDMYSLIEEKDILEKDKVELTKKIDEIITDNNRINNLISTIDLAIEGYDGKKPEVENVIAKENKEEKKVVEENILEDKIVENTIEKKEAKIDSTVVENKSIESENKTTITQATSIIHVKEDEDPFSKANDNDWDSDIIEEGDIELADDGLRDIEIEEKKVQDKKENIKSEKKESKSLSDEDYDFEIEDDDDYVFSDDEDSGFEFEEDK